MSDVELTANSGVATGGGAILTATPQEPINDQHAVALTEPYREVAEYPAP